MEDNESTIAIIHSGKNPTMRHLGRTHDVSVTWLHESFMRHMKHMRVFNCHTDDQAADIFTKGIEDGTKWKSLLKLIGYARERPPFTERVNEVLDSHRKRPSFDGHSAASFLPVLRQNSNCGYFIAAMVRMCVEICDSEVSNYVKHVDLPYRPCPLVFPVRLLSPLRTGWMHCAAIWFKLPRPPRAFRCRVRAQCVLLCLLLGLVKVDSKRLDEKRQLLRFGARGLVPSFLGETWSPSPSRDQMGGQFCRSP